MHYIYACVCGRFVVAVELWFCALLLYWGGGFDRLLRQHGASLAGISCGMLLY
uniref:Uncharacterized protein n=1 Tax=Anguilla anguilla TaxID=7936 RepID=A0A0E9UE29_ANGAN